jgi:hypothetical protein
MPGTALFKFQNLVKGLSEVDQNWMGEGPGSRSKDGLYKYIYGMLRISWQASKSALVMVGILANREIKNIQVCVIVGGVTRFLSFSWGGNFTGTK